MPGHARPPGQLWLWGGVAGNEPANLNKNGIKMLLPSAEKPVGEWNTYQTICRSNTVEIVVNGTSMNKLTGCNVFVRLHRPAKRGRGTGSPQGLSRTVAIIHLKIVTALCLAVALAGSCAAQDQIIRRTTLNFSTARISMASPFA